MIHWNKLKGFVDERSCGKERWVVLHPDQLSFSCAHEPDHEEWKADWHNLILTFHSLQVMADSAWAHSVLCTAA